jgi:transposase
MPERRRKYTPEFKDEAAKMVVETSRPIAEVAREIGVHEGTLGNWVKKYRVDHAGEEPPLSISDRARLRELEKENRELKMKADFLGKAAAFFAKSLGDREVRVHRRAEGRFPGREDVHVGRGVHLGIL